MREFALLYLATFLPLWALASNDWTQPCLDGTCSYDVDGPVSGSVFISGSSTAISDLTQAAEWEILDCDANSTAQDIRAVCTNTTSGCSHLLQGGAVDTIVRLPENCTQMPFARVAAIWDHENQTTAFVRRSRLFRRETMPIVKGISLDTTFSAIDPSRNGNVTFVFQGGIPNSNVDSSSAIQKRLLSFDYNDISTTAVVHASNTSTLFNGTLSSASIISGDSDPSVTVSGNVDLMVDSNVDVQLQYGIVIAGSVVPPDLTGFELFTGMNGSITGTLSVDSQATAIFDTGAIQLFQVGIPGLDIPGILSIGPTFQVSAEATVALAVGLDMDIDFNYDINNAELYFPSSASDISSANVSAGYSNVNVISGPNSTAELTITPQLTPSIFFGINVLDGTADATIRLALDAFAIAILSLQDDAGASTASNWSNTTASASGFGGDVNLEGGLNITASADASLFDLFEAGKSITLFSKTFELFQKDFGNSA
ncbi:uncharacterized protein LAESUDRAFT_521646 [Laetiporus sulphureus 93-53]|uniref:Uncharacterized protein n=1 Tax=Laetiporus sulphureus 93-53 TaxID=1314785 RepID=A0A165BEI2_9APHY|nr:uncharacterized protein LAESUDRAFT_521646 [Laetiporus sulphureus 93-53]KZT00882.1 hypothetical protein LAESUDRAFT_521646 [Laetiporus sulphureus 93-53]